MDIPTLAVLGTYICVSKGNPSLYQEEEDIYISRNCYQWRRFKLKSAQSYPCLLCLSW